eukprot:7767919-Pyramimonas_sp.AAC.1
MDHPILKVGKWRFGHRFVALGARSRCLDLVVCLRVAMSQGTLFHWVGELAVGDDDVFDSVYVTQVTVGVLGVCRRVQDEIITRLSTTGV